MTTEQTTDVQQFVEINTEQVKQQDNNVSADVTKRSNKEIIAYLAEKFPLCFSVEGEAKPLKIGVFQDLAEALADDENVSKTQLRHALRQYTSNWRYLHGCRLGVERVDLQGNPAGVLEQQHAEHAQQQLAEAKAKLAEKRAAEKVAAKEKMKKRAVRKPQQNKPNNKLNKKPVTLRQHEAKAPLRAVSLESLQQGSQVKVKVGDRAKNAVILEIVKGAARVQLDNGLVMNVTAERLFA
ncbi:RNA chaperone ProQ [Lonepinella koalarum]|uniref:RNA chaperone ProQ n=1 Tax=Lonepinella koalarum TaxID=53417 RepID=UPI0011E43A89|nr:RNA chaperone ProQ [Lonepinella koalarum]TYG33812.1 RNA chaperone ProQ [Lonepinella koalarum]